jgi:hypothetical protein
LNAKFLGLQPPNLWTEEREGKDLSRVDPERVFATSQ